MQVKNPSLESGPLDDECGLPLKSILVIDRLSFYFGHSKLNGMGICKLSRQLLKQYAPGQGVGPWGWGRSKYKRFQMIQKYVDPKNMIKICSQTLDYIENKHAHTRT